MDNTTKLQLLFASWPVIAALLVLLVIAKVLIWSSIRRHYGELRILSALRGLDPATYRHFPNLQLPHPTERGNLRIPHVVVSPFGIFVIDTSRHRGRITGSEHRPEWIQRLHFRRCLFNNPLHQNRLHVDALMNFLRLPDPPFHPVVVFTGNCEFKSPLPGIVLADGLFPWIRRHTVTMLDPGMVARSATLLTELQNALNRPTEPAPHSLHVRQAV